MNVKSKSGFTLIEILIVIVIIGITVGFALIAYGDFGASRRLHFAAEQLVNTLRLSQQIAILETTTLGLVVDNTGYQILKFQDGQWNTIAAKGIFKPVYFPKNTTILFQTEKKSVRGAPNIIINSTGQLTPFTIILSLKDNTASTTITGSHNGSLKLTASTKNE